MSNNKKPLKKRKRHSPPSSSISRRLEKVRSRRPNLWDNDDDDENDEPSVQPKSIPSNKTYIVLSDSDDEKVSSHRRSRSNKSRKKSSRMCDEHLQSDHDHKSTSKCATCLICSILSTLSSYNCCPKHLAALLHSNTSHSKHPTITEQWPPQQVMIVPMTDEIVQRYLNPQEIHRLRTQTLSNKKSTGSNKGTRKQSKKPTLTSEPSETEHCNIKKSKTLKKSVHVEFDQSNSSSSVMESSLPNSGNVPPDATFTVLTSTTSSFESPTVLDTCQLQQSADQPIVIDDSQPSVQEEHPPASSHTEKNKDNDPWTPISDDTYAAMEVALDGPGQSSDEQTEFTPTVARRTPTNLMASRLPKIQLRKGRFRQGKPIADKNTPDTNTNECRSSTSSISIPTPAVASNTRPPQSLATIVEDESLIIQTSEISPQPCQVLSERHENTTEGLSDTVMSCLFAQEESSQQDAIHQAAKLTSNEILATVIEEPSNENESNGVVDISLSSQLTNDYIDTQQSIPTIVITTATNEKTTTPVRVSYRMNPDGSRVSISRSGLPMTHPSPLTSLRRTLIDATPATSQADE